MDTSISINDLNANTPSNPVEPEYLAALFTKITSRLPLYIASHNNAEVNAHLSHLNQSVKFIYNELSATLESEFIVRSKGLFKNLIKDIDIATRPPYNLYELNPIWHELTDIANTIGTLLEETKKEVDTKKVIEGSIATPVSTTSSLSKVTPATSTSSEDAFVVSLSDINNIVNSHTKTNPLSYSNNQEAQLRQNVGGIIFSSQIETNEELDSELSQDMSGEKIWKNRAKKQLSIMLEDFQLRSVQIPPNVSWKSVYRWAKSTYDAISECQANIGLEKSHVGLKQKLNLCFNPESLRQSRGNGKMFADTDCNTLVLKRFPKKIQSTIWQHEYAHVLDNQVGMLLAREQMPSDKIHSCMFLSQIEQERLLEDIYPAPTANNNSNNYFTALSQNPDIYNAQLWMGEAISDAAAGSSSESFKEHHKKCSEEFSKTLIEHFATQCLGEENWLTLTPYVKNKLLKNPEIIGYVENIAEEIYKNGVRKFFEAYWQKPENMTEFTQVLKTVNVIIQSSGSEAVLNVDKLTEKFKTNLAAMSWDFLKVMRKYYYAHTNSKPYFAKSKTAIAASQHSLNFASPYHTRTLELFARSCEDLQRPLIISTLAYFMDIDAKTKNTENYLNPMLNRNERKIFISTLHSLVRALGMEVNPSIDLDALPALKETVKGQAHTTFSTATEDERIAGHLLQSVQQKMKYKF